MNFSVKQSGDIQQRCVVAVFEQLRQALSQFDDVIAITIDIEGTRSICSSQKVFKELIIQYPSYKKLETLYTQLLENEYANLCPWSTKR
jgi:hypothetical protein